MQTSGGSICAPGSGTILTFESRNYMVPGVIALIVMLTCLLLTSMSIVREREVGTMEQLMVTPIRPVELMLGKTIPAAIVGYFDMALVTVFGVFWFSVPINGAILLLVIVYRGLSPLGFGNRAFHLNHFENTAAGNDGNVLLLSTCHSSLRICNTHRNNARSVPVYNLSQPIEIFSCDRQGYLLKGRRD